MADKLTTMPDPLADLLLSTMEAEYAANGQQPVSCDHVEVIREVHADGKGETWTTRVVHRPASLTVEPL